MNRLNTGDWTPITNWKTGQGEIWIKLTSILEGPFRPGNRRGKWTARAATIFNDHFFRGEAGQRDSKKKM